MAKLWLYWLLTTVSFPISGGAAFALFGPAGGIARGALGGLLAGLGIGTAQWIGLRQVLPVTASWIPASAVGLSAGLALATAALGTRTDTSGVLLRGALTGAVLGLGQWIVLQQHSHLPPCGSRRLHSPGRWAGWSHVPLASTCPKDGPCSVSPGRPSSRQ